MSASIHFNEFLVDGVLAERNDEYPDLVTVTVFERQEGSHRSDTRLTADEPHWQTIVDRLAAIGIVAKAEDAR